MWPVVAAQLLWGLLAVRHVRLGLAGSEKLEGHRMPRSIRYPAGWDRHCETVVSKARTRSGTLQQQTGFDLYWKLYFALVRS